MLRILKNLLVISIFQLSINIANAQMPGQPANSYVSGSNWYCNTGYQKSGNSCVSIFASFPNGQPANSYVSGSNWYCNTGYEKSGNSCVNIFDKTNKSTQTENTTPNTYPTEQNSYEKDKSINIQTSDTPIKKKISKPKDMPNNAISGGLPPLKN